MSANASRVVAMYAYNMIATKPDPEESEQKQEKTEKAEKKAEKKPEAKPEKKKAEKKPEPKEEKKTEEPAGKSVKAEIRPMEKPEVTMIPAEELTEEERDLLERLEHRRWSAYMRSEGYVYSGSTDASSRDDLAKMHNNLAPFDDLSEEDKRKDSVVAHGK